MNRFNLTFNGEILAGYDPAQVKLRFANMFDIDDPVRLERFFSGETIILRRNLERKAAAQCYHQLLQMGALAALVKVADSEAGAASQPPEPTASVNTTGAARKRAGANMPGGPARTTATEQTWAVSNAAARAKPDHTRSKAEAATRGASARDAWQRDKADIAAVIRERKLQMQHQAAHNEGRERAMREELARAAAEAAARKQAEADARQRLAEEEAARAEAERARLAEEEAARQTALAEAAARREAEQEAGRIRAAEEARQREIERKQQKAEQALRKAKADAARKAQQQEKRRLAAEEKAVHRAALEEKKRQEKLEAARRKAEEAAQRKAALEEEKRRAAEEAARRQAALEQERRRQAEEAALRQAALEEEKRRAAEEAEEAARQQAELEELQRRDAEEDARLQAELAAIKHQEAEEAERLQAELEEQARLAAAQAERIKAEAQRQLLEAQRNSAERRRAISEALAARQARQAEQRRQSPEPPEQAQRAANAAQPARAVVQDLPLPPPAKRGKPRIRTALEVPPRKSHQDTPAPAQRKRQTGEPNVYKLRPFRNTDEVRTRAVLARRRARHSYTVGMVALAALLLVAGGFTQRAVGPIVPGARAVAIDPGAGPMLLADDALLTHDRAGVGTGVRPLGELHVDSLHPPLAFDDNGRLMALGQPSGDALGPSAGSAPQLLRCEAPLSNCALFSPELKDSSIDAFAINSVDSSVLLADRAVGLLLKADREGTIVARADATFAQPLAMRLHSGLLLMNSATAPAISVLRYENNAFGQQLDEILLLPPGVEDLQSLRVGDFLWAGNTWWVSLYHPVSGHAGLYRFDEEWNFLDQVNVPPMIGQPQLVNWGEKVLVNDPHQLAMTRISALGVVETPFVSAQMQKVSAEQQRRAWLSRLAWRGALLLCALGAVLGLGFGYLQNRRALVYQPRREQGAEPLEEHLRALQWIDPVADRAAHQHRSMIGYAVFAIGVLLLAVALRVGAWPLVALLLAMSGPAIALLLIGRRAMGNIGILEDRLLLVDHNGTYHLAGGSRVQYRGPFLAIDDVVVYCGGSLLPAFSGPQIQRLVKPLALGGVKVDRDTLVVKLLQSRHPLAQGALAITAALAAALVVLYLH